MTETATEAVPAVLAAAGALIRQARERAVLSQEALAGRLGVTQTAVSYWEAGKRDPGVAELERIADALGVRASSLLPEPHQPEPDDTLPGGAWGRVELPGYRQHTGWLTEETRFGVQMAVVRDFDGREVAAYAIGGGSRVVYLPAPLKRPESQAALPAGEYEDDGPVPYGSF